MSNNGQGLDVTLQALAGRIAESNRLLGMIQAYEEVSMWCNDTGHIEVVLHCLYKSRQVAAEHTREFGKGEG